MTTTETKLPKGFKKKWVDALRSGRFKQGQIYLYDSEDSTYCCLGVAEIVAGNVKSNIAEHTFPKKINGCKSPDILLLDKNEKLPQELASMNDNEIPFEVIAG